jgi:hypothetical protein
MPLKRMFIASNKVLKVVSKLEIGAPNGFFRRSLQPIQIIEIILYSVCYFRFPIGNWKTKILDCNFLCGI